MFDDILFVWKFVDEKFRIYLYIDKYKQTHRHVHKHTTMDVNKFTHSHMFLNILFYNKLKRSSNNCCQK